MFALKREVPSESSRLLKSPLSYQVWQVLPPDWVPRGIAAGLRVLSCDGSNPGAVLFSFLCLTPPPQDLDDIEDENEQLKQENKTLLKVVGQLTR